MEDTIFSCIFKILFKFKIVLKSSLIGARYMYLLTILPQDTLLGQILAIEIKHENNL